MNKIVVIGIIFVIVIALIWGAYFIITMMQKPVAPGANDQNAQPQEGTFAIQGMQVTVQTPGSGTQVKAGDRVTVNYEGKLADGNVFDSSFKRNAPFTFIVGQGKVIKGWDLGVVGMKVGEIRKLVIPAELAYGANGFPPIIPKNATLTFEVTMLKIN